MYCRIVLRDLPRLAYGRHCDIQDIWRLKLQAQVDFLAEVKAALAKKGQAATPL